MRHPVGFTVNEDLKNKALENDKSKWDRPSWFGSNISSDYMRKIIWQDTPQVFEDNIFGGVESYVRCPICSQKCAFMGAGIDHIIDWKNYAEQLGAKTYYDLNYAYHDLDNLILIHAGCNSHKKGDLTATLSKPHTATQTATWNRPPQIVDFCKLVSTLYVQENISFELKRHVETKIVKRFASGGWHPNNAYGSLRNCFGDAAVDKAVHKMVSGL